jgi:hypothetical protein
MFTISRKAQTAVCMILSAVIVSVGLSLGAFAAEHAAHHGYSVTSTQIQGVPPPAGVAFQGTPAGFGPAARLISNTAAGTADTLVAQPAVVQ